MDYFSRLETEPQHRVHLNLSKNNPVKSIEIVLAIETKKRDDDEGEKDRDTHPQQPVLPAEAEAQLDDVINMLPLKLDETAEDIKLPGQWLERPNAALRQVHAQAITVPIATDSG